MSDTISEYLPPATEPAKTFDPASLDPRKAIQLPGDNHLLSNFAVHLGRALNEKDIFTRGGMVFTVNDTATGFQAVTPDMLRSWVEHFCFCYKVIRPGTGQEAIKIKRTMTGADAAGALASTQFTGQLQKVERFNAIRMPVKNFCGELKLLYPGYDDFTKTFTADNSVPILDNMPLETAREIIDDLLAEFPFADDGRSKAVAIAAMLTVFGQGILPRKSLRPCFIFVANSEGAGKTLLVKCATVPVHGCSPTGSKPADEQEMRKVLLTAIMEARGVIVFDNVRGRLASDALEGFLTSQDWSDRVLGGSRTFQGENNSTVFITGNGCTTTPDLRRRSLFCHLHVEAERAEDRIFKQNLEVGALIERRTDILSALYAFILDWHKNMEPKASRGHSSFPDWANIIGGIVENAGYVCPLEPPAMESAGDDDGRDMRALVQTLSDGVLERTCKFTEIVEAAQEHGLFERLLPESGDLEPKTRASFSKLLGTYDRRVIGSHRFILEGKGRNRRFKVKKEGK